MSDHDAHANGHGGGQVAVQDTPGDTTTPTRTRVARTPKEAAPKYTGPALHELIVLHGKAVTPAVLDLLAVLVGTNGTAQRALTQLANDPAQPLAVRLLPAALAASPEARAAVMEMARSMTKGAK